MVVKLRRIIFIFVLAAIVMLQQKNAFAKSVEVDAMSGASVKHEGEILAIVIIAVVIAVFVTMAIFYARIKVKNQELIEANNAKSEFLSCMSHDMRTPMNAIINMSQFGMESDDFEEIKKYHEQINQSGKYLLRLINDTLDLNKLETNKMTLDMQPCKIHELINESVEMVEKKALDKGIELKVGHCKNYKVVMDKIRMKQVMINILTNAVKYTPKGGLVQFSVKETVKTDNSVSLRFIVKDNGIGISKEFQKKMFLPFEQEKENGMRSEPSAGLGLAIVHNLVEQMKGEVTCNSEKWNGTEFIIDMKFRIENTVEINDCESEEEDVRSILEGKRVLLVEDHPLNVQIAKKFLDNANITTEHAENGLVSLDMFGNSETYYYDAVLMDIQMPVMNGLEAASCIRKFNREDAKSIPIIAMTANAFEDDIKKSIEAGMNEHLSKPIDINKLYSVLAKYIRDKN